MKHLALVVAALLLIVSISSIKAVIYERHCLIFTESYDFDVSRYAGKWYEIRRLYDPNDVELDDCVQELYTQRNDQEETGITFNITRAVQQGPIEDVIYSTGKIGPRVSRHPEIPKFYFRYNTTDGADADFYMDIVLTDYTNYAIVYSCNRKNETAASQYAWVYSRHPVLQKNIADLINEFTEKHFNHPVHKWRTTEQSAKICKPNTLPDNNSSATMVGAPIWTSLMSFALACLLAKITL